MDQPSLTKFEKEIHENRDKKALVIDQRWNGGGNIQQELLAILVQKEYQIWQPRGNMEACGVQPDIRIENSPEDNLNGKDRQLEAAVSELLKEIGQ